MRRKARSKESCSTGSFLKRLPMIVPFESMTEHTHALLIPRSTPRTRCVSRDTLSRITFSSKEKSRYHFFPRFLNAGDNSLRVAQ